MKKIIATLSVLGFLFSGAAARASGPGSTTGDLLQIPVGARAVGMGEAYTAAANDSSSLEWNPAGLSFMEHKEAAFTHTSLIEGVNYEHLSFASPGDNYSYGFSTSYLGYGDIAGYNNKDTPTGNLTAYSSIFSGGVSTLLFNNLSLGMTASALQEKLADASAWTVAANLGSIYSFNQHPLDANYKVGMSVLNIGPGLKFDSERDPLPRKIKFGGSVEHIKSWPLNLSMDVTKPNDNSTYVALGSEYWFKEILALRLGYVDSNDVGKGIRLGVGLKLRQFLLDYAYGASGDFGAVQRIQLAMQWGERVKQMNGDQRRALKEAKRAGESGDPAAEIALLDGLLQEDPTNTRFLKQMIAANDKMLKNELREAVASNDTQTDEVPNPEQMALKELVPGQAEVAQGVATLDPLGLDNLPDVNNLMPTQPLPLVEPPTPTPPALRETQTPRASQPVPTPAQKNAPANDKSNDNGVMVNPSDIYGN